MLQDGGVKIWRPRQVFIRQFGLFYRNFADSRPLARSTSERVNEIMYPSTTELRLRDQGRRLRPLHTQGELVSL